MGEFDFIGFAKEVHQVAMEHGWWEGERDEAEICALIHSEWSEALEEHRAGRPMIWRECINTGDPCCKWDCNNWAGDKCLFDDEGKKPEGIAVELIDGVLRCMDFLAAEDGLLTNDEARGAMEAAYADLECDTSKVPGLVCALHEMVSRVTMTGCVGMLWCCVFIVWAWLEKQGVGPEAVLRMKHEYNKTRPYKHGKRY